MTERALRVARAVITAAPTEPVMRLVPDGWGPAWRTGKISYVPWHERYSDDQYGPQLDPQYVTFRVGQTVTRQTRSMAERKAELWRAHGCTVRIDVSEPIVWTMVPTDTQGARHDDSTRSSEPNPPEDADGA